MLTGGKDGGGIRVWDLGTSRSVVSTLEPLEEHLEHREVTHLAFSPDDRMVVAAYGRKELEGDPWKTLVTLWSLEGERLKVVVLGVGDLIRRVTWEPDGSHVYVYGSVFERKVHKVPVAGTDPGGVVDDLPFVHRCALATEWRLMVVVDYSGALYVRDEGADPVFPLAVPGLRLSAVAVGRDGKRVATRNGEGRVVVWERSVLRCGARGAVAVLRCGARGAVAVSGPSEGGKHGKLLFRHCSLCNLDS